MNSKFKKSLVVASILAGGLLTTVNAQAARVSCEYGGNGGCDYVSSIPAPLYYGYGPTYMTSNCVLVKGHYGKYGRWHRTHWVC